MIEYSKCRRVRDEKYMSMKKLYSGQRKWRCKAKKVCTNIWRRKVVK